MNWTMTYKASDQMWLSDSLNWEKTSVFATFDWSIISFIFQSSFLNQYLIIDHISKFSHLDLLLIQFNLKSNNSQILFNSFTNDIITQLNIHYLPLSPLFHSEYQEAFNTILLVSPELSMVFNDYFNTYYMNSILNNTVSPVFDIYSNNLNFYFSEGVIHFFLFFIYILFIVYFFVTIVALRWTNSLGSYFTRYYFYFYSMSKDLRIQFDSVLQTLVFLILY
jgi:hypothetical protein